MYERVYQYKECKSKICNLISYSYKTSYKEKFNVRNKNSDKNLDRTRNILQYIFNNFLYLLIPARPNMTLFFSLVSIFKPLFWPFFFILNPII